MTALRFAIISSCSETWGGSEELWFEAACALRDRGHRVEVFKAHVDADHPRIRELKARGCGVHDLNRWGPAVLWYAASSPLVAPFAVRLQMLSAGPRLMFPRRPDLAIVSQGGNFDGANLARLCRRLKIPYVLVSQKASPLYWPPDVSRSYIRAVHEDALRTVFVSRHNLELTRNQLNADLPRAAVVDNPVLLGRDGPLPWPADDGGPIRLACIGRLYVMEKGHDILIDVLARPRWRERPITVDIYGSGLHRQSIAEMAARRGLHNVTVHDFEADIESVMRDHHGIVLPSRTEGMPLVVHEAMACGRIAIVTDAGGTAELVEDGVNGFVATDPGPNAFDEALERAWRSHSDWPQIAARAAERLAKLVAGRPESPLADIALNPSAAVERAQHELPDLVGRDPERGHEQERVGTEDHEVGGPPPTQLGQQRER